ncbi:MAG TPA: hypothetical protein PLN52_18035, partial [Opitutaceae bacterium]|nr:hypothetical protein [Opitutaceae bacterium]
PPTAQRIGYSSIVRAGRDDRGLVVVVGRAGGLFVPTGAFASPAQRDAVFSHLRSALKKEMKRGPNQALDPTREARGSS